jgi:hypothetical protein
MGRVGHRAGRAAPGRDGPSAAWGLRRARAGAALAFGLVGAVYFTWAARLPAVKADLGLSDGQLAVALVGSRPARWLACRSAASLSLARAAGPP